ncbi:alpha-hydroxy acid oxidase [Microbacterium esteraromaticum]|uniref:alpha-hydroxy acid oxidase n=1 Tax=Microbacterium TaxID=33882 RepID=UPI0015CAFE4B|nr:alpha-hydroxy acid oxidase [Microbacterium esteraromaticum]MBN7793196.1 alpha-hydroxy-acid oxidizing protein [Microbacterium esteraromaticum]WDH79651.1 alpha-hydroxy acid oxidase [Microbacterium esteraromaticum]
MTDRRRIARRIPTWGAVAPLLGFRRPVWNGVDRRLAQALSVKDLARIARRTTPRPVFDYVHGAAEDELSIARARQAFAGVEFEPRVLHDVAEVDTSTTILGARASFPLIMAPTGFTRMMHHEGEIAVARAAARAGVPYTLSTMGTTSPGELRGAVPDGANWFQLYLWKDRDGTRQLIDEARRTGYDTLVLTVDTPVAGNRLRDARNGLTIPPTLNLKTMWDMAWHPSWWFNVLTTDPIEFASLRSFDGTVAELATKMFDPSLKIEDLAWLREEWDGKLVVKGIQSVADAERVVDAGADALVVSNHGGRQLDRAPTPLRLLPEVASAVGDRTEIFLDTGILSGADVLAAVGLGADACMVGRAYLYGLMAGGERGVDRMLQIMRAEAVRTMQLSGVSTVNELRGRVRLG